MSSSPDSPVPVTLRFDTERGLPLSPPKHVEIKVSPDLARAFARAYASTRRIPRRCRSLRSGRYAHRHGPGVGMARAPVRVGYASPRDCEKARRSIAAGSIDDPAQLAVAPGVGDVHLGTPGDRGRSGDRPIARRLVDRGPPARGRGVPHPARVARSGLRRFRHRQTCLVPRLRRLHGTAIRQRKMVLAGLCRPCRRLYRSPRSARTCTPRRIFSGSIAVSTPWRC